MIRRPKTSLRSNQLALLHAPARRRIIITLCVLTVLLALWKSSSSSLAFVVSQQTGGFDRFSSRWYLHEGDTSPNFLLPKQSAGAVKHSSHPTFARQDFFYDVNSGEWRSISELPRKRIVFLHIVSHTSPAPLRQVGAKASRHDKLYRSARNSSVLILTGNGVVEELLQSLGCDSVLPRLADSVFHIRQAAFRPLVRWFDADDSVEYFFQPIVAGLPEYYLRANYTPVPYCYGTTWSFDYAFWSGAVTTYHVLHLAIIKHFDFLFKIDLDVRYYKNVPHEFFDSDIDECDVVYTALKYQTDCERNTLEAMKLFFSQGYEASERSFAEEILAKSTWDFMYFYGNFVGLSTKMLLSPGSKRLANFLYEEYSDGYFKFRWGDQAPMVAFTSYYLKMTDAVKSEKTCDRSFLRDDFFQHSAAFKKDSPFT